MALENAKRKGYHSHYNVARLEEKNGQRQYEGRKRAPQEKIKEILRENHNLKLAEHPGIKATLLRIRENWTWDGIRKDVERYIRNCQKCQRNTQEVLKRLLAKIQQPRKNLEVSSDGPHHKATSSQTSRRDPSDSGLVLGNGALHSEHKKTDCRAGLGRLLARRMETTRIITGNNHKPRNNIYKRMVGVDNSKRTD